jgi:large subunit ribosomal protein L4
MPRKQRRLALRSALAVKAQEGQLRILDGFTLESPRTREVAAMLTAIDAGRRVLVVLGSHNEMLERSARNIPEVRVILASNLNVRDLLTGDTVLVTRDALEHIGEVLS